MKKFPIPASVFIAPTLICTSTKGIVMKNDQLSLWPAVVEVENVRFSRGKDLGIDFSNEIDAWSKMEFRYRHQMKQLRQYGTLNRHEILKDVNSFYYSFRHKLD